MGISLNRVFSTDKIWAKYSTDLRTTFTTTYIFHASTALTCPQVKRPFTRPDAFKRVNIITAPVFVLANLVGYMHFGMAPNERSCFSILLIRRMHVASMG